MVIVPQPEKSSHINLLLFIFSKALIVLLTIAFSPSKVACKNPPGVGYTVEKNNLLDKLVFSVINRSSIILLLLLRLNLMTLFCNSV